jgi:uncharacterized protein (TIGR03435 family)
MTQVIAAVLLGLGPASIAAQSPGDNLRFEVASVTPHVDTGDMQAGIEVTEGFVRIRNLPLRAVIGMAYGVRDSRLVGPASLDRGRFDIMARPPAGWDRQQMPAMLRALLAERFTLIVHREKREVTGYALRVHSRGHRMRESNGPRTFLTGRPGLIAGNGRSVRELVNLLEEMTGAPVVDETGLKGTYDLKLEWTPQLATSTTSAEHEVSLFTALQEQLGLRLEAIRVQAEVVVVDSVASTPTEN